MTDHLFGIMGLTPGGLGIWAIAAGLFAWYIRGMADRKRAGNEGLTAESMAADVLFKQLQSEIDRLTARISRQDARIDELDRLVRECEHQRIALENENAQLRAAAMLEGRVRQESAKVVAADRMNGQDGKP